MAKSSSSDGECRGKPDTADKEDGQVEAAVVEHLFVYREVTMTETEIVEELTNASDQFGVRDSVHRAIRTLVGMGVLHRLGQFVIPSRATIRLAELLDV